MIGSLDRVLRDAAQRRRTIEVYSPSPAMAEDVAEQFETKNVTVTYSALPASSDTGFLILRDGEGEFLGSIGQRSLDAVLSPDIHPPWVLAETETNYGELFDFLDNTLFTSFDRSRMLATAREIEERAWRVAAGNLYTGFQRVQALRAQTEVYEHLAYRGDLSVRVFVSDEWDDGGPAIPTTVSTAEEIGSTWFLVFDGGHTDLEKCALIAEERQEGSFYGLWTYEPGIVDDVVEYLETTYPDT